MARRKAAPKRTILPDPLFHSELLAKFINTVMRNGKKSIAETIVYGALDTVFKQVKGKPNSANDNEDDGGSGGTTTTAGALRPVKGNNSIHNSDSARALTLENFKRALDHVMPAVEVRSRRVGGSTYPVPVEIRSARRMTLAMRWLVEYANKRSEKTMKLRLANEILDAIAGRGGAVKKREDVHRMAKANQAFSHYRW